MAYPAPVLREMIHGEGCEICSVDQLVVGCKVENVVKTGEMVSLIVVVVVLSHCHSRTRQARASRPTPNLNFTAAR